MFVLLIAAAVAAAPPVPAVDPGCAAGVKGGVCRALQAQAAGDNGGAAAEFEDLAKAAEMGPERDRALAAAGNLWLAAGQPGKAALALDTALAGTGLRAEQRGEALLDRARVAETQNDFKTAHARLTEATQSIAEDPFLWYFATALAIREGDAKAATTAATRALSIAPDEPLLLFEAGHAAQLAGDTAGARTYWTRTVTKAASGSPEAKGARAALDLLAAPPPPESPPATAPRAKAKTGQAQPRS